MKKIQTIIKKEIRDNFRDKRSIMMAMVYNPVIGAGMLVFMAYFLISMIVNDVDKPIEITINGQDYAPNLIQYLKENNVEIKAGPDDPEAAILNKKEKFIVDITPDYGEKWIEGQPAGVNIFYDDSENSGRKQLRKARSLLNAYNSQIAGLRMQARGIDPQTIKPINIQSIDISTPSSRSTLILNMIPLFLIITVLTGGLYLAIDMTAGEKERNSLEPLLTLPISRKDIVTGKYLTTVLFGFLSYMVLLTAYYFLMPFIPLEKLDMQSNFGLDVVFKFTLIGIPLSFLAASLLMLCAAYAKSFKEAQTYIPLLMLITMIPMGIASFKDITTSAKAMLVPNMSQNMIMLDLIKGNPVPNSYILISGVVTLVIAFIIYLVTVQFYKKESLLQ